jgi:uncharacterized protein (TIGR00730 family)
MSEKREVSSLPISQAQIEHLINEYSTEHHVSPKEMVSIMSEFIMGFEFLRNFKKAVSVYGSARLGFNSDIYQQASLLTGYLAADGFVTITGGGSGIMEAANKGAFEAGGKSIGLNIGLKHEQKINKYVTESREFRHFYIRKTMLSFASKIYIFFPGGFGTLDELFEMITLIQTEKIPRIPIILVNKSFWQPLVDWIEQSLFKQNKAIDEADTQIYYVVDNADEAYQLINELIANKKVIF